MVLTILSRNSMNQSSSAEQQIFFAGSRRLNQSFL